MDAGSAFMWRAGLAHHHLGEMVIVDIGAGRDPVTTGGVPQRRDEGLVAAVEVGGNIRAACCRRSPSVSLPMPKYGIRPGPVAAVLRGALAPATTGCRRSYIRTIAHIS